MKMIMLADRRIASKFGHVFMFKKGVPLDIPDIAISECMEKGAAPVEGEEVPVGDESIEDAPPQPGPGRDARIQDAMKKMMARNTRDEFTGAGKPVLAVLDKEAGFKVDTSERDTHWDMVRAEAIGE